MDEKINYSNYTLEDLQSALAGIDREAYPERAEELAKLVAEREQSHPEEADDPKADGKIAGRVDRLFAVIIDGFIALLYMLPFMYYIGFEQFEDPSFKTTLGLMAYGIVLYVLVHGYFLDKFGQTIGKNIMRIRIENLDGTKASISTIILKRSLPMQLLSLVPGVGQGLAGLIDPLFIFGKERRCIHDYVAKTKVSYAST